jgi:hypothetical protein
MLPQAMLYLTVFGDIFVVMTRSWEVLLTSRPQGAEVVRQPKEHRVAPQVYKIMHTSIFW